MEHCVIWRVECWSDGETTQTRTQRKTPTHGQTGTDRETDTWIHIIYSCLRVYVCTQAEIYDVCVYVECVVCYVCVHYLASSGNRL